MSEYKLIDGYDGLYRVSDGGDVQSCHVRGGRGRRGDWWSLSQPKDSNGYALVYLWDKSKGRIRRLVHQVVAEAFLGAKPSNWSATNHKDGNKSNNTPGNLEWTTRAENMRHAWRTGLCKAQKLTPSDVREIRSCGGTDTATAKRFGISQVMATRIRAGKAWRGVV